MTLEEFQNLPTEEVARLVRAAGPKVCVFPINGTRRWFMLEHPEKPPLGETFLRAVWQRQTEMYKMLFAHGVDTLLTPIFGPDLLERGEEYVKLVLPGLLWCAQNQDILGFYEACDVRVRVYGDTRRYLNNTPYACVLEAYEELARRTAAHRSHRLFFGVCAHDAAETVAEIGARFYQEHGRLPTRREIVKAYYGEYVEPASFFIGFDRPVAFDFPLLDTGNVDLYFTVSPSPYLDERGLRTILYDHLYTRRVDESGYGELEPQDRAWMEAFYQVNLGRTIGIGMQRGGVWYPLPQVQLPADSTE
jgi:hypothetical protein